MKVIELAERQYREAIALSEYAFQYKVPGDQIERRLTLMKKHHQLFGILEGNQLAAKLHLLPFEVNIGDEMFKMGGIAGVATYPEYRRSGHVKELLKHVLQKMKQDGFSVSMLHPFAVSFYRKYGWELFANRLICSMTKNDLVMQKHVEGNVKRFNKDCHPSEIEAVYATFAKRFAGMLIRSKDWWIHALYHDLTVAVYYNEENEAIGYMFYKINDSKMTVEEFVPLNHEARIGLWNFICQHDSMIKELKMILSETEPLLYTLQEPRVKTEITPYFMARIVDVEQFLNQYPFVWSNQQNNVILHISDSFAPWNNVTVQLQNKEIVIVNKEETEKQNSSGIHLNINALSTILFGYKRPLELYEIDHILGSEEEVKTLEQLIPLHRPFIYDFF
ncbi:GNAT family N-acetyltransferase [Bacillus pseudomycoides]|uniref:GNAT family N-acetyltransferase n=1 Tax=Bacillus pseudomycoides TaxID=64104 RepID=UPI000BEC6963|nr:GNAT family N-acetyltransferase [Bacillus pseudomycoides]PED72354.1 GNAT family N-acetyltransferase [Bacillus pseudomycoides]PEI39511.1 GNAT family N-acetyltransferase [Bacillus pseudomycoides]PEJ81619.1 GNAT family N-acetyltransferase [Bacillus pseudomycoides]PEM18204.1 GNAT family N-acetyltransferase [Bacillus pseudomycoides]PEO91792.1 GNAT family N-acetyltransferase [Bacillus pseudomycoides]